MADTFDPQDIQRALDTLTQAYESDPGFVSVGFTADNMIVLRFLDAARGTRNVPSSFQMSIGAEGQTVRIEVRTESGPEIAPAIGDVEKDPPYRLAPGAVAGEMGGDQCRNANSMTSYGTIAFYAGNAIFAQQGGCNLRCETSPVMISNNHVIARSDAGKPGEVIWTPFRADTAKLHCVVPLRCNADLAFAKVTTWSGISSCRVRSIGSIFPEIRKPILGEGIRKHGARSGFTAGIVDRQENIRVGNRIYYGVYRTSRGFGCPGDSGSLVVRDDSRILGLYSWGEVIDCADDPRGWFWPLPDKLPTVQGPAGTAELTLTV